jgi:hypothetical protein
MVAFNFYVEEHRVVVREGGGLVDRLGDGWGCLQREEGMLADVEADSIVNFLVEVFEQIRFGGVRAKLRRRYFNGCAIAKPTLAKLAPHG